MRDDVSPDLARFRDMLTFLDAEGPPAARLLAGAAPRGARLAVMSGSFNPPTRAHVGLAHAALAGGDVDRLLFALAVRTIDKERIIGAPLAERCALLASLVAEEPRFGAVACNRGLYLDQAIAIGAAFAPRDLAFVAGFDKIVQILDPKYYADRAAALHHLFTLARFLVAPRDGAGAAELALLFAQPENRPYAERVRFLPLSALEGREQRLSATLVRAALARGEDVAWAVPPAILPALRRTDAYRTLPD